MLKGMGNMNMVFKPIKNGSLAKTVMEQIEEAMLNKELLPGDRLPTESELCKSVGVGKSSVREAIKMLEALGVVEIRQGDGTYIAASISEKSINPLVFQLLIDYGNNADILELRSMFEPAYMLLAMEKATVEDVNKIRKVHEGFKEKISRGVQTADDDIAFHLAILEATHNAFIIRIGTTIVHLYQASITSSMKTIPQQAIADHENILKAFIAKDKEALLSAVQQSLKGWISNLNQKTNRRRENGKAGKEK